MSKTLQVGDKAPTFALPDQDGNMVDIGEIIGKKALVLTSIQRTSPVAARWRRTSSGTCTNSSRLVAPW